MKRFVLTLALPLSSLAQSAALARYIIRRDANGKLVSLSLSKPTKTFIAEPNLLDEMREEYDAEQSQAMAFSIDDDQVPVPDTAENKETYDQARAALSRKLKRGDLDNPELKREFAKADESLSNIDFFQLIAAPSTPDAFDQGRSTKLAIDGVLLAGSAALTVPNLVSVFKFLVYQHVESLESRRVFYQNQLLVILDSPEGNVFSEEEKNLIRSSILYSRISITKSKTRRKARASWSMFGTKSYREFQKECAKRNPHPHPELGACFQNQDREIKNDVVIKHRKPATAFKYDKPYSVRNHRRFLMLTKLGAQFVPVPGVAKMLFNRWIDSHYVPQRRAEGYLHGSLLLAGQSDLAQWVIVSSANPKLN